MLNGRAGTEKVSNCYAHTRLQKTDSKQPTTYTRNASEPEWTKKNQLKLTDNKKTKQKPVQSVLVLENGARPLADIWDVTSTDQL